MASDTNGGIVLDVGELPDAAEVLAPGDDTGPDPYEILARLYAHLWHRIPLARSVAKKFEGTGNSSGPFADLVSLFFSLARRNEAVIQAYGKEVMKEFASAAKERSSAREAKQKTKGERRSRFSRKPKSETQANTESVSPIREVH